MSTTWVGVVGAVDVGDPDAAVVLFGDVEDLDVASQFDAGVALQVGAQQRLEVGLVEHIGLRKTVDRQCGVAAELGEHPHRGVEQTKTLGRP